jgi:hypothetical protein
MSSQTCPTRRKRVEGGCASDGATARGDHPPVVSGAREGRHEGARSQKTAGCVSARKTRRERDLTAMTDALDPATFRHLERLARSNPRSGRGQQAKVSALRTLERLQRPPQPRPEPPPLPRDWHPGPDEFCELDACDSAATRERWWRALMVV